MFRAIALTLRVGLAFAAAPFEPVEKFSRRPATCGPSRLAYTGAPPSRREIEIQLPAAFSKEPAQVTLPRSFCPPEAAGNYGRPGKSTRLTAVKLFRMKEGWKKSAELTSADVANNANNALGGVAVPEFRRSAGFPLPGHDPADADEHAPLPESDHDVR